MTKLESLSAQLEAAVKMQANAERLYHKSAEKIEKLKMQMGNNKATGKKQKNIRFYYL